MWSLCPFTYRGEKVLGYLYLSGSCVNAGYRPKTWAVFTYSMLAWSVTDLKKVHPSIWGKSGHFRGTAPRDWDGGKVLLKACQVCEGDATGFHGGDGIARCGVGNKGLEPWKLACLQWSVPGPTFSAGLCLGPGNYGSGRITHWEK